MSKKQIAILACRILAIFAFMQAFSFTQLVAFQVDAAAQMPEGRGLSTLSAIAPVVLLILFAVLLWVFAEGLAQLMIVDDNGAAEAKIVSEEFQIIGFSVLGLFLLVRAIPEFTGNLLNYILIEKQLLFRGNSMRLLIQFSVDILKIILGLGLLFGARGLAGLIKTFRTMGLK